MEVALAATVLALTLVGMIQVVESGSEMLDLSRKQTIAAQILQGEIDELRLQAWSTISGDPSGNGYQAGPTSLTALNDPAFATFSGATGKFTLTRYVSCIEPNQPNLNPSPYSSTPLLLQVTFTVSWTGVTGHTYKRTSTTFVGKNGLNAAYQRS